MCVQPMKSIAAVALSSSLSEDDDGYDWDVGTMAASGIITGGMVLFLGSTGLIEVVNRIVPRDVVSGLQIGVGLRLAGKGIRMVAELGWIDGYDCILLGIICSLFCMFWLRDCDTHNHRKGDGAKDAHGANFTTQDTAVAPQGESSESGNNRPLSSCNIQSLPKRLCLCLLRPFIPSSITRHKTPHPVGVYLFLLGVLFATITLSTATNNNNNNNDDDQNIQFDLPLRLFGAPVAIWTFTQITRQDWKVGLLEGAIPQLPLTTLNSVISVCALAQSLYPSKPKSQSSPPGTQQSKQEQDESISSTHRNDNHTHPETTITKIPSRKEVAISVGLINLLFCPFGSMPNCHGAGGLAGQHRLGARYGTSVVFLGLGKVVLAVFWGRSALTLLDAFPSAVLGVMLAIAGQELATTGFMLLVNDRADNDDDKEGEEVVVEVDESENGRERVDGDETTKMMKGDEQQIGRERKAVSNMIPAVRQSVVISTITAMVIITLGKTHYGALSGWVAHMIYGRGGTDFMAWCRRSRRQRTSARLGRD